MPNDQRYLWNWNLTWTKDPRTCRIKPGGGMGESRAWPSLITNTDVPLSNSLNPHWSHLVADRTDWLPLGQLPGVTMSNRVSVVRVLEIIWTTESLKITSNKIKSCVFNDQFINHSAIDHLVSARIKVYALFFMKYWASASFVSVS